MIKHKGVISLLGCGWLGFPLAVSLITKGFRIKASTTSREKLSQLKNAGIDPFLVQFSTVRPDPDLSEILKADTLIISIPPGQRNNSDTGSYQKMVRIICNLLPGSGISTLIFISSTSVYANSNEVINESMEPLPDTASGKLMKEAEILFSTLPVKVIVLRLAGLIGSERLPGKFFAGKTDIPNGDAPVNLVHLDDVINSIHCILENKKASGIYNICTPSHPTKAEFYSLAAQMEGLQPPGFLPGKLSYKIVSSERLQNELNYKFKYPSLIDWLKAARFH